MATWAIASPARADQVQMQNGDRYQGKVVSLTDETVVLQSEVIGLVKLPRGKVSSIQMAPVARTPAEVAKKAKPAAKPVPATNANALALAPLPQLGTNSADLSNESVTKLLEGASPEAKAKFNDMVTGLLSGKLTEKDIRAEAKSVAAQVRAMRGELGEEAGGLLDTYLAILDQFTNEAEETPAAKSR